MSATTYKGKTRRHDYRKENPDGLEVCQRFLNGNCNAGDKCKRFHPGKPRSDKPDKPRSDKPWSEKPRSDKPRNDKPRSDKPRTDKPRTDKPRNDKPRSEKLRYRKAYISDSDSSESDSDSSESDFDSSDFDSSYSDSSESEEESAKEYAKRTKTQKTHEISDEDFKNLRALQIANAEAIRNFKADTQPTKKEEPTPEGFKTEKNWSPTREQFDWFISRFNLQNLLRHHDFTAVMSNVCVYGADLTNMTNHIINIVNGHVPPSEAHSWLKDLATRGIIDFSKITNWKNQNDQYLCFERLIYYGIFQVFKGIYTALGTDFWVGYAIVSFAGSFQNYTGYIFTLPSFENLSQMNFVGTF